MSVHVEASERLTVTERELIESESLGFRSAQKQRIFDIATVGRNLSDAAIEVSRWEPAGVPEAVPDLPRSRSVPMCSTTSRR